MNVTVIGTGFVGVVSAAVFSSFGNRVTGLDIDAQKVQSLRQGKVPFYEPQLEDLLREQQANGNLSFTSEYSEAIPEADVVLIAVGTPSAPDGTADLKYVKLATEAAAPHLKEGAIVCVKSTVPPGSLDQLRPILESKAPHKVVLASLPEFLREGSAVQDTLHPDRVVIGCDDEAARQKLAELHAPFQASILFTSPESAQMGKYASNAYLATRITFINQVADLCELNGADVQEVIQIIGQDKRIGSHYWYPGLGYGGSCFPKDVRELAAYSRTVGLPNNLFNKINELNDDRIFEKLDRVAEHLGGWQGKTVAVLGLAFKPNTDDMREAPSTRVIPHLLSSGAQVTTFDPMATEAAKRWFTDSPQILFAETVDEALQGVDVVLALIEWPEITGFDFAGWKKANAAKKDLVFFDARNQFDLLALQGAGWKTLAIGRRSEV